MANAVASAYNVGLVWSPQQGPGAELLVRGSSANLPEAETLLAFGCSMIAANLLYIARKIITI